MYGIIRGGDKAINGSVNTSTSKEIIDQIENMEIMYVMMIDTNNRPISTVKSNTISTQYAYTLIIINN